MTAAIKRRHGRQSATLTDLLTALHCPSLHPWWRLGLAAVVVLVFFNTPPLTQNLNGDAQRRFRARAVFPGKSPGQRASLLGAKRKELPAWTPPACFLVPPTGPHPRARTLPHLPCPTSSRPPRPGTHHPAGLV